MHRFARITAAAALATNWALPALAQDAPAAGATSATEVTADTVVAEVNGHKITIGNMIAMRAALPDQYKSLPDDVLFDGLLKQMIQQAVLDDMLGEPTRAESLTIENQTVGVRASMMIDRILAQEITDDELKAAYDARFQGAAPETEYNASHILVETEDEAKAIEEELKNGGDFAAIAKEKSKDPGSGANGGDLGWFGVGMMVPDFEQAVVALKPGEVSAPVQTQFGWHVIRLNDTRLKAAPTMDEMKDELTQQIRDKKVQETIDAGTAEAKIVEHPTDGIDKSVLKNEDLLK